ncbi:MAG: amino acid permease [Burkholderiales bacterium]|nr:amino acid permease [Bacteroidia bacterium]
MNSKYKIGFYTAISLVIANMIGTGVFTSLGFQLFDIHSVLTILVLWLLGGIISFCGALVYAELGVAIPRSGGEYVYLSKLMHPSIGFMSGWVSSTVGFAAPVALASMALGTYVHKIFPNVNITICALTVVALITLIHTMDLKFGSSVQKVLTMLKVIVIVCFIIAGLFHTPSHETTILPQPDSMKEIFSAAFWVSLIYVSYAYSGWNAASYLAGDMQNPQKNLPKALLLGTLLVTVIYVLLNFVFMYSAPMSELTGVLEIGHVSAAHIFGETIGKMMSLIIAFLLLSSISAMIMAGPRIIKSMGEDLPMLSILAKTNKNNVPFMAVITQSFITVVLILSSQFEAVLTFVGFSLSIFTFLTVSSIFILRYRQIETPGYKTWGYPVTPILFLLLNGFTIYFVFTQKPVESLLGLLNVAIGGTIYFIGKFISEKRKKNEV